jgi:hypothetical protein
VPIRAFFKSILRISIGASLSAFSVGYPLDHLPFVIAQDTGAEAA